MQTAASEPELSDYLALLRRRWRVVVAAALAGLVLAAVALVLAPKTYTATTSVQVRPTGLAELTGERIGRTNGEVNLDTEAQVVRSIRVADAAARLLGTDEDPVRLRERVDVTVPPNSSVLDIDYSAGSPTAARAGSAAFADAYLAHRRDEVTDRIDGRLAALRARAEDRYETLEDLAAATTSGKDATRARAESRIVSVQDEISDLNGEITPLSSLRDSMEPGQVISPASAPESATAPRVPVWLAGGLMLGLLAGLSLAHLGERRDPRLHHTRDVRRCTPTPVLLDLADDLPGGAPAGLSGLLPPAGRGGQRVNSLALTLGARSAVGGRLVLVPGVSTGPSAMFVAANLAAALARMNTDVLLVCADPDGTAAQGLLELPTGPGLAEALAAGADPGRMEYRPGRLPGLRVLRFGERDAVDLLQCASMTHLLRTLRTDAECVVVATAPLAERADAQAMAAVCDTVLPVVDLGRTGAAELAAALRVFAALDADLPGLVTVRAEDTAAAAAGRTPGPAGAAGDPDRPAETPPGDVSAEDRSSAAPSLRN
ncbi:capsular polysaccharide biosynthesis protein [Nocardiopsis mwathae]|uniref:Capsular polysaccharide biosynthesis protein n=1 Tax=Nocardiopsis mwathae TaxID=1472723 RepID=A0A7W9YJU9_9ACTN|nr:Wzz/FepE/Etk N-terminal domain-containing protein [Nocardiopsis mwathae]MBB6173498.1 capsular polysaccharide biosynthesis protein [Nocardiopsis mwathae]